MFIKINPNTIINVSKILSVELIEGQGKYSGSEYYYLEIKTVNSSKADEYIVVSKEKGEEILNEILNKK